MATKTAPKGNTEIATLETAGVPAEFLAEMEQTAGQGMETVTQEDMLIPFLAILQTGSPQVDKRGGEYVTGAEASMIFNTALQRVYDGEKGILFIPVKYRRAYDEWKLRDEGGGYMGPRTKEDLALTHVDEKNRDRLPNGNQIVTSAQWYGFVLNEDGSADQAVLSMSSTQLKKSRRMISQLGSIELTAGNGKKFLAPLYYSVIRLTTVPEENDQGKWFGWKAEIEGNVFQQPNGKELFERSKVLYKAVTEGHLKAADPVPTRFDDGATGGTAEGAAQGDDGIPF